MHVLFLNYGYDPGLNSIDELLQRFHVLTGCCEGIQRTHQARVSVVQRFPTTTTIERSGVTYHFIADGLPPKLHWWQRPVAAHNLVTELKPDIVHVNGIVLPLRYLRPRLKHHVPILWQHRNPGIPRWYSRWFYRGSFRHVDAVLFTSLDQAREWQTAGVIGPDMPVYPIPGGSTMMRPTSQQNNSMPRNGQMTFLWVGRLIPSKDPLTVIHGFARIVAEVPHASLNMIYSDSELLPAVRTHVRELSLENRVHLIGRVDREDLPPYYARADCFVLGSHGEVTGLALAESMAFGVTPVVTDIAAFRTLCGDGTMGFLWKPGDPVSFSDAARRASQHRPSRTQVQEYFQEHLSYDALGRRLMNIYRQAIEERGKGTQ
jgi:glycosyltransferase involved in cell wall biosynthesis